MSANSLKATIKICTDMNALPNSWETLIWPEIKKNEIYQNLNNNFPWLEIVAQLISANFIDKELIEKVMSSNYLNSIFNTTSTVERKTWRSFWSVAQFCILNDQNISIDVTYMEKALIIKRVETDLSIPRNIVNEFGEEYVITKVVSKYGHFIQNVMQYDVNQKTFLPFKELRGDELHSLEEIPKESSDIKL